MMTKPVPILILLVLFLAIVMAGTEAYAQEPEGDLFQRLNQYDIINNKNETIGNGHIFLERFNIEGQREEFFTKTINLDFSKIGTKIYYKMEANLKGLLRQMDYQKKVDGEIVESVQLHVDRNNLDYTVKKGGRDDNGSSGISEPMPNRMFVNQHAVLQGKWTSKYSEFKFSTFNTERYSQDELVYEMRLFKDEDLYVPTDQEIFQLTLASKPSGSYPVLFTRILLDKKGIIYRGDMADGHSLVLVDVSGGNEPEADTDWYDIMLEKKKVGYSKISRKPVTTRSGEVLEVKQNVWIVESGKTYEWAEVFHFNKNLQLEKGSIKIRQGSLKLIEVDLEVKGKVLKISGKDIANNKKIKAETVTWPAETVHYQALSEYFRTFIIQEGLQYSFTSIIPVFRNIKDAVKFQVSNIQFTAGKEFQQVYEDEDVTLVELKARVGGVQVLALVDKAGRLYRLERFNEFGLMGVFVKVPEEVARNFKPDDHYSFLDENNKFHFRLGFRRDPFVPLITDPGDGDGGPNPDSPTIAEEEKIYDVLEQKYRELEETLAKGNYNIDTAATGLLELEIEINQYFYWPTVKNKVSKLIVKVRDLGKKHSKLIEKRKQQQAEAKMVSIHELLKNMEKNFKQEKYQLVFSIYDEIDVILNRNEDILGLATFKVQIGEFKKRAAEFRDRALAMMEFQEHEGEIQLNGVIVGEDPQIVIINNSIIGSEGDQVLVIRNESGAELGKVYIFKIDSYGVTFDYKGEHIVKGFETIIK
ncbi:hypothetical protein ACFL54_03775 [Planctomycetota bacterium]